MRYWFVFLGLALLTSAQAADPEVEFLLQAVEASSCVFVRNGDRHDSHEAAQHLRRKYAYAGGEMDAETFIAELAGHSSLSGKPYLIQCPGREPAPSADWLRQRLRAYRALH